MPLFPELSDKSPEELLRAFDSGPGPTDDVEEEEILPWLDEVARFVAEKGEAGLNALLQRLLGADEAHARAILGSLAFLPKDVRDKHRPRLEGLVRSFLADPRPAVLAEAVDALRYLDGAGAENAVRPLLEHASPEVVGSALRFFAHHRPAEARPLLLRALQSPEPLVRENAVDELDDLGCVEALPQLRGLVDDEDENVRQAARTAVSNLEELQSEK
jgi:HEAT repeat protein